MTRKGPYERSQHEDELLALAKEEGYELSDEEMEAVSGGLEWGFCDDYDLC